MFRLESVWHSAVSRRDHMGFGLASFAVQIQQLFGRALMFLQVGDDEEGVQEKVIGLNTDSNLITMSRLVHLN